MQGAACPAAVEYENRAKPVAQDGMFFPTAIEGLEVVQVLVGDFFSFPVVLSDMLLASYWKQRDRGEKLKRYFELLASYLTFPSSVTSFPLREAVMTSVATCHRRLMMSIALIGLHPVVRPKWRGRVLEGCQEQDPHPQEYNTLGKDLQLGYAADRRREAGKWEGWRW